MGAAVSNEEEEDDQSGRLDQQQGQPDMERDTEKGLQQQGPPVTDVSVSPRQQGDGMEEVPPALVSSSQPEIHAVATSLVEKPSARGAVVASADTQPRHIYLPDTGIRLAKLPPISEKVDLLPKTPSAPLFKETPRIYPRGSYPPAVAALKKAAKEPKFVPYEPYKGAVRPFIVSSATTRTPTAASRLKSTDTPDGKSTPRRQRSAPELGLETGGLVTEEESREDAAGGGGGELEQNYRAMLQVKEREIEQLRQSLQTAEKQLKIQTQVNAEVKKLLVASVGEDIEARVDFLTQDKARLAADVIQYNNKISRDWEEKEALHVESEVWRSKFLASTLIVEEVSRGRQLLASRCEELEHGARRLILERNQIRGTLAECQSSISALLVSFDPLGATTATTSAPQNNADVAQLGAMLAKSCASLRSRLIGETVATAVSPPPTAVAAATTHLPQAHADSPAERDLKRLLQQRPVAETDGWRVPEEASSALARGARPLLLKLGDQQAQARGEFSNCSHCHGTVQIV